MAVDVKRQLIKQLIDATIASPEIQANLLEANKDNIVISKEYLRSRLEYKTEDLQRLIADDWEALLKAQVTLGEAQGRLDSLSGVTGFVETWPRLLIYLILDKAFLAILFLAISVNLLFAALLGSNNSNYITIAILGFLIAFGLVLLIRVYIRYSGGVRAQISTEIKTTEAQISQLYEKVRTVLLEEGILPELRVLINDHIDPSYEGYLELRAWPDLVEMVNTSFQIPTEANNKVLRLLRNMRGGSLGIAGSRGAGKTTLIWSFCNPSGVKIDDQPMLSVMISAPVEYNAREFILYLFMSICHRVLQLKQETSETGASVVDEMQRSRLRTLFERLGVIVYQNKFTKVAFAFAMTFGILAAISTIPPTSEGDFTKVMKNLGLTGGLLGGLCIFAIAIGVYAWIFERMGRSFLARREQRISGTRNWRVDWTPYQSMSQGAIGLSIAEEAQQWIREIRFQQGFSSGWSGTLKIPLPINTEAGVNSATSLSQLQLTMPEIIGGYRGFLSRAAVEYRLVIGIDELDKLASAEKAQRFLNEIKSIFGLEKCFYLVSVSENAMSSFERRGLPFRDEFDSTFDTIIEVDYLNLQLGKRLLQRRVIGLPVPFLCLCYCLSGGLARDMIRACRNLLELTQEKAERGQGNAHGIDLSTLTYVLVKTELRRKVHAISIAAKEIQVQPDINHFFTEVYKLEDLLRDTTQLPTHILAGLYQSCIGLLTPGMNTNSVQDSGEEAKELLKKRSDLMALRSELGTYLYYSLTLTHFFGSNLVTDNLKKAENNGDIEQLARARQFLSVNPGIAQVIISDFRSKYGMEVLGTLVEDTASPSTVASGNSKVSRPLRRSKSSNLNTAR
jgi:hypothetical protein